ncbi:MAG TPA: hypothetical protein PKA55_08760 [Rhodoblastus sp.]|nr:hypothetical protein [Rhodoblastus sp.]
MKTTVWSLQIQKASEETFDVFGTQVEANAALQAFLAENWRRVNKKAGAMPDNLDEAASIYFDCRPDEMATITPHDVFIPPDAPLA